jgi:hypothetical protein
MRTCLVCSIPMIGLGSEELLCARCACEYPGVVTQAEKEVLRDLREEAKEQRRLREIEQRRSALRMT